MKARSFLCKIKDVKLTSKLLALYVVMILLFVGSTVLYYCGSYDALVREGQMLSDILVKQTKSSLATSMDNIMRAIFDTYNVRLLSSCLPGRDANENYYAYAYSVQNSLIEFLSLADNVNWIVAVDANDEAFYSSRRFSPRINYAYRENLQRDKADCMNFQGRLLWRRQEDGTINVSRMLFALPSMRYTGYVIVNIDADVFGQDAQPLANAGSIVFDSYGTPMLYTLNDSMLPLLELDPGSRNDPAIDTQTYSLSWESITNSSLWLCQIVNALCRSIDWKSINCSICGVASNGTDALAVINNAQPNIVITDILMPGFSGLELAAMAKKTHQSTKFIIITGFSNAKFARQSVRLSVFDYISKPVDNEEIVKVVLEAIDALRQDNNSLQKEPDDVVEAALSAVYGKIGSYSKLTSDVIRYVNENYSQPKISLQATAAEFFVSPSYLSGHFKEETGIGFISFLTMVRLVQAKKQLESGHASISQVAYQVGYKDYSYFFQVFKKYYGYAPGHFIN